jgi:DNA-binding CsgD family transcriptional regulator
MSNREVAEAMFLSLRTVEYHLGNVYRKLEVHGRGALARALDSTPVSAREARE